jgi:SAM-dependent methyltransferase
MTTRDVDSRRASVWGRHAGQWSRLGSPLRPSAEDINGYQRVVRRWAQDYGRPRIALWGVTPEIVEMPLPDGAQIVAIDNNWAMLDLFPPAARRPGAGGICADWRRLPLAAGSRDIVLGDGCFAMVNFPDGFRQLARVLCRVLAPAGVSAFRFYLRPEPAESINDLVADLRAGLVGNFHAFKLRAAMALQETPEQGIAVGRVFEWWAQSRIEPAELTAQYGWHPETIATIEAYRDREDVYTFPTLAELRWALGDLLVEVDCRFPGYELGARCPLIELRPNGEPKEQL